MQLGSIFGYLSTAGWSELVYEAKDGLGALCHLVAQSPGREAGEAEELGLGGTKLCDTSERGMGARAIAGGATIERGFEHTTT